MEEKALKTLTLTADYPTHAKGLSLSAWPSGSLAVRVWSSEEGALGGITLSKESQRELYEFLGEVLGEEGKSE